VLPVLGGSAAIVVFEKLSKIALFDLQKGCITRFIAPPKTGLKVAGGGTRLVLADPNAITWYVLDLTAASDSWTSYGREGSTWTLLNVTMSPYRSDLAWFVCKSDTNFVVTVLCALNEKEPLCPLPTTGNTDQIRSLLNDDPVFTVSASGLTMLGDRRRSSHSADVLRLDLPSASIFHSYKSVSFRGFQASVHPRLLVTADGLLELPDFRKFWTPPAGFGPTLGIFPIFGSESFVHLARTQGRRPPGTADTALLRVLHVPNPDPKAEPIEIPLTPVASGASRDAVAARFPYHVHAAVGSRRLAIFDNSAKTVRIVTLPKSTVHPAATADAAVPGARFTRVLKMPEFTEASLADAPDGMIFNPKTRTLDWDVPKNIAPNGIVEVLFLLTLPDGKQAYHVETVKLQAAE
jgi:hypothetical protein